MNISMATKQFKLNNEVFLVLSIICLVTMEMYNKELKGITLVLEILKFMAEVYIIGQLLGASNFPDKSLFCKWSIHTAGGWRLISGVKEGQTQIDNPIYGDITCWSHPIDVHYATKGIQGWPKIHVQVYHYDKYGRSEIYGYGFCHMPTSPGTHNIECYTWRPIGTFYEEFRRYFLGGGPQLRSPDLIYTGADRYKLQTEAMGSVHFELNIILRNFKKFGVET